MVLTFKCVSCICICLGIDQRICTFEIFVRTLFWFDHREQRHWRNHKSSGADHGDVAEQCAVDSCILDLLMLDLLMYRCNLATLFSSPPYLHFLCGFVFSPLIESLLNPSSSRSWALYFNRWSAAQNEGNRDTGEGLF